MRGLKTTIHATDFQEPLAKLTETIALKISREAVKTFRPEFATTDIYMMLKQCLSIYKLSFYIVASERHRERIGWNSRCSAAAFPLVRGMIDCLYNITVILSDPLVKAYEFRKSGYRQRLKPIEEDATRYGGDRYWDDSIKTSRRTLALEMSGFGFDEREVVTAKRWPTLGQYLWIRRKSALHAAPAIFEDANLRILARIFRHGPWHLRRPNANRSFVQSERPTARISRQFRIKNCRRDCFSTSHPSGSNLALYSYRDTSALSVPR